MIKDLIRLANRLDEKGLQKEADIVDKMILRLATEEFELVGGSGIDSLERHLSSFYPGEVTIYAKTKEKNKTTYKVSGCTQRHINHLKGQGPIIEAYGRRFTMSEEGSNIILTYYASDREGESMKKYEIKIPKEVTDEDYHFEVIKSSKW